MTPDYEQRQQALDIGQSIAVLAPAGSGKTELLVQRALRLLTYSETPEQVLIITFTRKATFEMRERIINAMQQAVDKSPITSKHQHQIREIATAALKHDQQQGWQLLQNSHRLQVKTIDSLCHYLASNMFMDSGYLLPLIVNDNTQLQYRQAVNNLFLRFNEGDSDDRDLCQALEQLLRQYDNNCEQLSRLLCEMLDSRTGWVNLMGEFTSIDIADNFNRYAEDLIEILLERLKPWKNKLEDCLNYAQSNLDGLELPKTLEIGTDNPAISQWQAFIQTLLLTKQGAWRQTLNKGNGFPPSMPNSYKQDMLELLEAMQACPMLLEFLNKITSLPKTEAINDRAWCLTMDAITLVLPHLMAELDKVFQTTGICDHSAMTLAAFKALRNLDAPTELALRLDYRIQHILVDEFQDTSSFQVELLELLTEGWQPGDGRTLFIVGDAMQSIYSFRQANVGLFIRACKQGIGNLALNTVGINANFRSQKGIVSWVNQSFDTIFPPGDSQNPMVYRPSEAIKQNLQRPAVDLKMFSDGDKAEAESIAQKIAVILKEGDDTIGILVSNRAHLKALLPALARQSIPWQANDIWPLMQSMAVIDLHSLTRAIHSGADRLAWIGLLRSPLCGLDMQDLYYLCSPEQNYLSGTSDRLILPPIWECLQKATSNQHLSPQGRQILSRMLPILSTTMELRGLQPTSSLIENCWRALGGLESLQRDSDRSAVDSYLTLLEQHQENANNLNWQLLEQNLHRHYVKGHSTEAENSSPVQIMTIYKAKGLEFDHVFLPALNKTSKSDTAPLLRWNKVDYKDGKVRLLFSPKPAIDDEQQGYFHFLQQENARLKQQERSRLLYVGCTRAIKHLYLSCVNTKGAQGEWKKPSSQSLLHFLWPDYKQQFIDFIQSSTASTAQPSAIPQQIQRLAANFKASFTLEKIQSSAEPPATVASDLDIKFPTGVTSLKAIIAQCAGTLLHRTLRQVLLSGIEHWQIGSPRRQHQQRLWNEELRQQGFDKATQKRIIQSINQGLDCMLGDEQGQWILDNSHEDSCSELSMDYLSDDTSIKTIIIDRTFIDRGQRWIIDYKSSTPDKGQSLDQFFALQQARYRPQLDRYQQVLNRYRASQNVQKMLYFPLIGTSCPL